MSAYIVEKKTIDRIVTYVAQHIPEHHIYAYYPTLEGGKRELGQRLWNMNAKAVDKRYSENNPRYIYRHSWEPATLLQVYKTLQCFLYQCCEGTVIEMSLYKDVEKLMHSIADDIIRNRD